MTMWNPCDIGDQKWPQERILFQRENEEKHEIRKYYTRDKNES